MESHPDPYELMDKYSAIYMGCELGMFKEGTAQQIQDRVNRECYYRLSDSMDSYKVQHNLELAEKKGDLDYLDYLKKKLSPGIVRGESDVPDGTVKKKIVLRLKPNLGFIADLKREFPEEEITPAINLYIQKHHLQDSANRYLVRIDGPLSTALGLPQGSLVTMLELHHLLRPIDFSDGKEK